MGRRNDILSVPKTKKTTKAKSGFKRAEDRADKHHAKLKLEELKKPVKLWLDGDPKEGRAWEEEKARRRKSERLLNSEKRKENKEMNVKLKDLQSKFNGL